MRWSAPGASSAGRAEPTHHDERGLIFWLFGRICNKNLPFSLFSAFLVDLRQPLSNFFEFLDFIVVLIAIIL
jgi:hypothetical protein